MYEKEEEYKAEEYVEPNVTSGETEANNDDDEDNDEDIFILDNKNSNIFDFDRALFKL